ncbi:MAG: restriction endonuclease subunit S [Sulfitobacter sp.]
MMTNTAPLGELVNVQTGKLDANASSANGAYPFFTCAREPLRIAEWKYDLDAILIAGNGDLNVKHYIGKFDAYQRTYILDVKKTDVLDSRFLFHFMDKYVERLREQSIGGIIKYIKLGMITEAKIPLPSLEEQKRIAGILDQADALRRLRTRALDKLNTLGQAIFHEMFGDGGKVRREPLGDLIEARSSLVDPTLKENAELPHVGPEHIKQAGGIIEWRRVVTCREDGVTSGKYRFEPDDVIYSKIRPYLNKVAIADRPGMCSADMYALLPKDDRINTRYLHAILSSSEFLAYSESVSGRANIPKMNRKQLMAFEAPIPASALQTNFEHQIEALERESKTHNHQAIKAESLFASLQHRAFRGEL